MSLAAQPSTPRQPALVWFIRGTGLLVAGGAVAIALYILGATLIDAIHGRTSVLGWIIVLVIVPLFVAGLFGFIFKRGYDIFRELNPITVADFASIMALLLAIDWYSLLPWFSKVMAYYRGDAASLAFFAKEFRIVLAYCAFFLFYRLIKACVFCVLELNSPQPPQNRPPDEREFAQFPQKSPLLPL